MLIPPWTTVSFTQAKSIVEHSARKTKTSNEIAFGAGSPSVFGGKFEMKTLTKDVESAIKNGCRFYVTAFPQDEYVPMMRQFSREIIPSFKSQTRLVTN